MGFFDIFKKKKNVQNEEEIIVDNETAEAEEQAAEAEAPAEQANTEVEVTTEEAVDAADIAVDTANEPTADDVVKAEDTAEVEDVVEDMAKEEAEAEAEAEETVSEIVEETADNSEAVDEIEVEINEETEASQQFGASVIDENEELPEAEKPKMGFFSRLKKGLQKTREDLGGKLASVFTIGRKIDEDFYEELEEILIQSDVGVRTAMELVDRLRDRQKADRIKDTETLQKALVEEIESILLAKDEQENRIVIEDGKLNIILVVGVNGAGKTTTIGKMAHYYRTSGKKVLLAAADTFRAAAIEQLCEWGERVHVPVIRQSDGSDPGAVVFDACQAAKSRKTDVLIVDTAGRLQNKKNLMEELKKINKIITREAPGSNVECLLVLDSGTGQNAISQAKLFGEVVPLTGIILTKLDGTAKGGVVIGITNELSLPVKMIGVGESMDDLREFVPADFARALFEADNEDASNYNPLQG